MLQRRITGLDLNLPTILIIILKADFFDGMNRMGGMEELAGFNQNECTAPIAPRENPGKSCESCSSCRAVFVAPALTYHIRGGPIADRMDQMDRMREMEHQELTERIIG